MNFQQTLTWKTVSKGLDHVCVREWFSVCCVMVQNVFFLFFFLAKLLVRRPPDLLDLLRRHCDMDRYGYLAYSTKLFSNIVFSGYRRSRGIRAVRHDGRIWCWQWNCQWCAERMFMYEQPSVYTYVRRSGWTWKSVTPLAPLTADLAPDGAQDFIEVTSPWRERRE